MRRRPSDHPSGPYRGHHVAPADGCSTFRALDAGLEEFERDLHVHIHLENDILFPRAVEMVSALA